MTDRSVSKQKQWCPDGLGECDRGCANMCQRAMERDGLIATQTSNQNTASRDPNAQGPSPLDLLQRENERLRAIENAALRVSSSMREPARDSAIVHVDRSAINALDCALETQGSQVETSGELERLRKLEEHVERVACWVNPQDVYLEIRRTRDDIYNAREQRRRVARSAEETSVVAPIESFPMTRSCFLHGDHAEEDCPKCEKRSENGTTDSGKL